MGLLDSFRSLLGTRRTDVRTRFELLKAGISGTMSKFYMARDRETGQVVGLKVLDQKKTADFESRFPGLNKPSEGEITSRFDHPRIVRLLEHGVTTEGQPYLVLEFLEGQGLNSLLVARSPQLDGRRVKLLRQAAEALAAVHKAEFIHRDICPRNFIVAPDGESLKLIDFGLTVPATPPFMMPGNRTGNPNYMAPELIRRQATSQRVDVFAFGVTAYETCAFELPWSRGLTGKSAMDHATRPPAEIVERRPQIDPRLARAIMSCLVQDPAKRCPSMTDFLSAIKGVDREDV